MLRAVLLAGLLAVVVSAPARAGEAKLSKAVDGVAVLSFVDETGVPDDIRVASPAKHTITLLGPTVLAGAGCVPVPGGASCTHPDLTDLWEIVSIQVGGGDDTVTVEAPQQMVIAGGEGNDHISLGPAAVATAIGLEGDDTLVAAGSAILRGGDGNDHLSAGARSALSGDAGTDRLDGSPQDDVLVDAGDRGARDVIACHGGNDVTQGDETDALEDCTPPAIDDIARVKFWWEVRFGPRLSVPTTLRVRYTPFYGEMQSPFARCIGAACHGARLEYPEGSRDLRIVSGGRRVRIKGRWWRGVSPGAKVHVGLEFRFGSVILTKGFEFRTRARKLPTKHKRCTVTILAPSRVTGHERVVPCT